MATYMYLGSYTAEGAKGLLAEGGTAREKAVGQLLESLGGRLLWYGFLQGNHDFFILADVPEDRLALVPTLLAGASGTVKVSSSKVFSTADIDFVQAKAASVGFRAAGH